jgi:hypothetical protein
MSVVQRLKKNKKNAWVGGWVLMIVSIHGRTWVEDLVAGPPRLEALRKGGAQPDVMDDAWDGGGLLLDFVRRCPWE